MAFVSLKNVTMDLPIYDVNSKSIRQVMMRSVGGEMTRAKDRVSIQVLQDINFELHDGDRLALIGHNGAGKTTLLRVVSGILEPPIGTVTVSGSMSSMTDVTMGMDVDCTGWENIRLRCIFLGMTFEEADAALEDIGAFTQLGSYLDLPIRVYSTGMLIRLGFAASTVISPDILVMDELIGAGDMAFSEQAQQRVLNYLEGSKIMLLASHDTGTLRQFCNKGILLEKGKVLHQGDLEEVINMYEERERNRMQEA